MSTQASGGLWVCLLIWCVASSSVATATAGAGSTHLANMHPEHMLDRSRQLLQACPAPIRVPVNSGAFHQARIWNPTYQVMLGLSFRFLTTADMLLITYSFSAEADPAPWAVNIDKMVLRYGLQGNGVKQVTVTEDPGFRGSLRVSDFVEASYPTTDPTLLARLVLASADITYTMFFPDEPSTSVTQEISLADPEKDPSCPPTFDLARSPACGQPTTVYPADDAVFFKFGPRPSSLTAAVMYTLYFIWQPAPGGKLKLDLHIDTVATVKVTSITFTTKTWDGAFVSYMLSSDYKVNNVFPDFAARQNADKSLFTSLPFSLTAISIAADLVLAGPGLNYNGAIIDAFDLTTPTAPQCPLSWELQSVPCPTTTPLPVSIQADTSAAPFYKFSMGGIAVKFWWLPGEVIKVTVKTPALAPKVLSARVFLRPGAGKDEDGAYGFDGEWDGTGFLLRDVGLVRPVGAPINLSFDIDIGVVAMFFHTSATMDQTKAVYQTKRPGAPVACPSGRFLLARERASPLPSPKPSPILIPSPSPSPAPSPDPSPSPSPKPSPSPSPNPSPSPSPDPSPSPSPNPSPLPSPVPSPSPSPTQSPTSSPKTSPSPSPKQSPVPSPKPPSPRPPSPKPQCAKALAVDTLPAPIRSRWFIGPSSLAFTWLVGDMLRVTAPAGSKLAMTYTGITMLELVVINNGNGKSATLRGRRATRQVTLFDDVLKTLGAKRGTTAQYSLQLKEIRIIRLDSITGVQIGAPLASTNLQAGSCITVLKLNPAFLPCTDNTALIASLPEPYAFLLATGTFTSTGASKTTSIQLKYITGNALWLIITGDQIWKSAHSVVKLQQAGNTVRQFSIVAAFSKSSKTVLAISPFAAPVSQQLTLVSINFHKVATGPALRKVPLVAAGIRSGCNTAITYRFDTKFTWVA